MEVDWCGVAIETDQQECYQALLANCLARCLYEAVKFVPDQDGLSRRNGKATDGGVDFVDFDSVAPDLHLAIVATSKIELAISPFCPVAGVERRHRGTTNRQVAE